jgi:hypothetical protein
MTWVPDFRRNKKLWMRHPIRMLWFAQGCCPVCESSPPDSNCPVCYGTYEYGPKITPGVRAEWVRQFHVWLEQKNEQKEEE